MTDPKPARWLAAATAAQRAARAVAVDPTCEPRRAAAHIVDAWMALVLATWPEDPIPSDAELPDRAASLLARGGVDPRVCERTRSELAALLVERTRTAWDFAPFTLRRADVEAHTLRLGRLIAAAREPAPRSRRLLRGLGLGLGAAALGLLVLRPWQAADFGPWRATYFTRHDLKGSVVRRNDVDVDFDWGRDAPLDTIPADRFSVRWDTCLTLADAGEVAFQLTSDDGSRLFVDGKRIVDNWGAHPLQARGGVVRLTAGVHHLRVEYFDITRDASVVLRASLEGEAPRRIPAALLHAPPDEPDTARPCAEP